MRRLRRKQVFQAALFAAAIISAGCAAHDEPPPPSIPDAGPQPKLVNDLSALSPAPINPVGSPSVPEFAEGTLPAHAAVSPGPRTFQSQPGVSREVGTERNPATVRMLNDKAAKFGNFSAVILERVYAQLIIAERSEEISRSKLPTELKPVIITAILDKTGKLTELVLEQHSGKAKIDKLMLDVCKRGIWYENPPAGALSGDGNYQLTIRATLKNFASSDGTHWSFITDLGLGLS